LQPFWQTPLLARLPVVFVKAGNAEALLHSLCFFIQHAGHTL
jgi:hypothetical protein